MPVKICPHSQCFCNVKFFDEITSFIFIFYTILTVFVLSKVHLHEVLNSFFPLKYAFKFCINYYLSYLNNNNILCLLFFFSGPLHFPRIYTANINEDIIISGEYCATKTIVSFLTIVFKNLIFVIGFCKTMTLLSRYGIYRQDRFLSIRDHLKLLV